MVVFVAVADAGGFAKSGDNRNWLYFVAERFQRFCGVFAASLCYVALLHDFLRKIYGSVVLSSRDL